MTQDGLRLRKSQALDKLRLIQRTVAKGGLSMAAEDKNRTPDQTTAISRGDISIRWGVIPQSPCARSSCEGPHAVFSFQVTVPPHIIAAIYCSNLDIWSSDVYFNGENHRQEIPETRALRLIRSATVVFVHVTSNTGD